LTATYRPKTGGVNAKMTGGDLVVPLDKNTNYYVQGFNLKGETVLYDAANGYTFLIESDRDGEFKEVIVQRRPLDIVGFAESLANTWEKQISEKCCWLAAVAVLCGRTQREIQVSRGWKEEEDLFSISMSEIPELGQMLKVDFDVINWKSPEALYNALNSGKPVMLGVPGHIVVIYQVSADKTIASIWDPDGAELKWWTMKQVNDWGDGAFVTRNRLL